MFRSVALALCLLLPVVAAPKFIPPDDTRPLIRCEELPMDVPLIHQVANQLAILAQQPSSLDGADLHRKARLLTLAQRLHPTLPKARRLMEVLEDGSFKGFSKKGSQKSALKALTSTAKWLLKMPPSSEGYLLALLIIDTLPPKHPLQAHRKPDPTEARWAGAIAPLSEFIGKTETPVTPPPPPPKKEIRPYLSNNLNTSFPFIGFNPKTNQNETEIQALNLVLSQVQEPTPAGLTFTPPSPRLRPAPLHKSLKNLFQSLDRPLPRNHRLDLKTDGVRYLNVNQENIATPLAMMLDAALSGDPLRSDTILFARLKSDSSLISPVESWPLIQALRKSRVKRGTRLIVPRSLENQLLGILTQEDPDFFLRYEIIAADTFAEAKELFYADRTTPSLTEASTPYLEVCEKAPNTNLGAYLAFKGVRSRLQRAAESPEHLSAKLLLIQASGKRPANFERRILAREIRHQLTPIENLTAQGRSERSTKAEYAELRDSLNELQSKADISDRPLIEKALSLIKPLPGIARSIEDTSISADTNQKIAKLRASTKAYRKSLLDLSNSSKN